MEDTAQLIHTLLQQLAAIYGRESDQILQEQLGIGYSQYKILDTLVENPAAQQKHIAFQLGQTEASISRQVKLLHAKGILESRLNPANRREHITKLTAKGQRLIEAAHAVLKIYHRTSLAALSSPEQKQLLTLLDKFYS